MGFAYSRAPVRAALPRTALCAAIALLSGCYWESDIQDQLVIPDAGDGDVSDGDAEPGHVLEPPPFAHGADIRDLATDGTNVYWVEYGTRDALHNYRDDGRLLAMPLEGGESWVVVSGLSGPVDVALTSGHAYITLDALPRGGGRTSALVRVPLAGGDFEVLQTGPFADHMPISSAGDRAFWWVDPDLYTADADGAPSVLLASTAVNWHEADGDRLYYSIRDSLYGEADVYRMPIEGGASEHVRRLPGFSDKVKPFFVSDGTIYVGYVAGSLTAAQSYLQSASEGGLLTNVADLGLAGTPGRIEIRASVIAIEVPGWLSESHVWLGSVSSVGALRSVLGTSSTVAWAASRLGLFHTDGSRIDLVGP